MSTKPTLAAGFSIAAVLQIEENSPGFKDGDK
jgi:hypothetical protein